MTELTFMEQLYQKEGIRIFPINHSIAYTCKEKGNFVHVEVNKHLKNFDSLLYDRILEHELYHVRNIGSLHVSHEMHRNPKGIGRFLLRHPLALGCLLPMGYSKRNGFWMNWFNLFYWVLLFAFIIICVFWYKSWGGWV